MRNWMMLQFEPTALRASDEIYKAKNAKITAKGENMAATLYRLQIEKSNVDIYQTLANRVKELIEGVNELTIDKDEKRDLLTLQLSFTEKIKLPAQSLSDGTLRFLCLAILEQDTKNSGLLCLEEPENGINPLKIEAMLRLLQDIAVDTDMPIGEGNPLRQVIINTHSPLVVGAMDKDAVIFAKSIQIYSQNIAHLAKQTQFMSLSDTWREGERISLKEIISYLGAGYNSDVDLSNQSTFNKVKPPKVAFWTNSQMDLFNTNSPNY
jgi:predicted ATPase